MASRRQHQRRFLTRALVWFAARGVHVRRVLTDNAMVYRRGTAWGWVCSAWQLTPAHRTRLPQNHRSAVAPPRPDHRLRKGQS